MTSGIIVKSDVQLFDIIGCQKIQQNRNRRLLFAKKHLTCHSYLIIKQNMLSNKNTFKLSTTDQIRKTAVCVFNKLATQKITNQESKALINVLDFILRIVEGDQARADIETCKKRLEALEKRLKKGR